MKISFRILLFLPLIQFLGCRATGFELKGKLNNANKVELYFDQLLPTQVTNLDKVVTDENGNFEFHTEIPAEGFYRIRVSDKNYAVILIKPNDRLSANGDAQNLSQSIKVEGSKEAIEFMELNSYLQKTFVFQDSLQKVYYGYSQQGHPRLDSIAQSLDLELQKSMYFKKQYIVKILDTKPGSLLALAATEQLNPETDVQYFMNILPHLEKNYPNSEYVKNFRLKVNELSRLAIGTPAPEISITDPEGNPIRLSDFKGKIVLIDFWASWCGPCRRENPNVVNMYKRFHDKGFEIFSVSLDKDKNNWIGAIKTDGLIWKHGSELAYWQSSFCKTYNITGIPMTFLIDKDGKILAKGLRGQDLENKLVQLFGN
ncbi:MAG: AhpC/TSA family protein [Bacteroidia bacterium]|nr:AhpC/TSA family protein [Bacteroidia bacterium]